MKLVHTCYRITDPDKSEKFYTALGLEKRRELPDGYRIELIESQD